MMIEAKVFASGRRCFSSGRCGLVVLVDHTTVGDLLRITFGKSDCLCLGGQLLDGHCDLLAILVIHSKLSSVSVFTTTTLSIMTFQQWSLVQIFDFTMVGQSIIVMTLWSKGSHTFIIPTTTLNISSNSITNISWPQGVLINDNYWPPLMTI